MTSNETNKKRKKKTATSSIIHINTKYWVQLECCVQTKRLSAHHTTFFLFRVMKTTFSNTFSEFLITCMFKIHLYMKKIKFYSNNCAFAMCSYFNLLWIFMNISPWVFFKWKWWEEFKIFCVAKEKEKIGCHNGDVEVIN